MHKKNIAHLKASRSNFVLGKQTDNDEEASFSKADPAPSPQLFEEYISWACIRFQIDARVNMIRTRQNEYVSSSDKIRLKKQKPTNHPSKHDMITPNMPVTNNTLKPEEVLAQSSFPIITIYTIYDTNENLVELKFGKDRRIPREIIKVIGLLAPYQSHLTSLIINRGIDNMFIHELNKFLPYSNITDVCLDNTVIRDANYHVLLEANNKLRQLSLARCKIDDNTLIKIVSTLAYPLSVSKTLIILNLSSNQITDIGTKYIADVLRSNRKLAYLNLANNSIGDDGSIAILQVLIEFPVSIEEITSSKSRYLDFLKRQKRLLSKMVINLGAGDADRKNQKKKTLKPGRTASSPTKKCVIEDQEEFIDPFSSTELFIKEDEVLCYGNNQLAYLNLSCNDISYFTVKKLLTVLKAQRTLDRQPRGLLNVSIEGNYIPENCTELNEIDEILNDCITSYSYKTQFAGRKKHDTARSGKS